MVESVSPRAMLESAGSKLDLSFTRLCNQMAELVKEPHRVASHSLCTPSFLRQLSDPSIKTVMVVGTGGGFDFVHSMLLYPELRRLGKRVVIGSFSFGAVSALKDAAPTETYFKEKQLMAKKVFGSSKSLNNRYKPEIGLCDFLDQVLPEEDAHYCYAYYARDWGVGSLTRLYSQIVADESVDALICFDGGSDSLMVGDEEGLGDPIEDAVTVATVASFKDKLKATLVISIGLGADRFNHVSDCASLRAIAELSAVDGYTGCMSIEKNSLLFQFYVACVTHIYSLQSFRSVLTSLIMASGNGLYGHVIPPESGGRVTRPGQVFVWPLMSTMFTFEASAVARRSICCQECAKHDSAYAARVSFNMLRDHLRKTGKIRDVEDFPLHSDMCN